MCVCIGCDDVQSCMNLICESFFRILIILIKMKEDENHSRVDNVLEMIMML